MPTLPLLPLLQNYISQLGLAMSQPSALGRLQALRRVDLAVPRDVMEEAVWAATREEIPVVADGKTIWRRRTHAEVAAAIGVRKESVSNMVSDHLKRNLQDRD